MKEKLGISTGSRIVLVIIRIWYDKNKKDTSFRCWSIFIFRVGIRLQLEGDMMRLFQISGQDRYRIIYIYTPTRVFHKALF